MIKDPDDKLYMRFCHCNECGMTFYIEGLRAVIKNSSYVYCPYCNDIVLTGIMHKKDSRYIKYRLKRERKKAEK